MKFDVIFNKVNNAMFDQVKRGEINWKEEGWCDLEKFCREMNNNPGLFDASTPSGNELVKGLESSDYYYIAFGKSPSGEYGNCVVMHRGEMVHDHGSENFILGNPHLYIVIEKIGG